MKSSVPCDQSGMCVTCVVLVLFFFSPGYFVLVVYLTLGQQNIFPTKILQNREEKPLLEARRAVGQGVPPLGSAWGGQLDWPCRADGNQASPAAYKLCGRLAGP